MSKLIYNHYSETISIVQPNGITLYITEHGVVEFFAPLKKGFVVYHRERGPAVIYPDGHLTYLVNHKTHRANGPAVLKPNGHKEYYINGIRMSKVEYFFKQDMQ